MWGVRRSEKSAPAGDLPDEIYIAFVDGLVFGFVPMFITASAVTAGEIAAAVTAEQPVLLWASASQLVIAAARIHFARRHARVLPSPTVEIARRQEQTFSRGALASLSALSLWTLLAFCVTENSFAQFIGVTMTITYAFSMMSRSYAIYRGINTQLFVAFVPLAAAMIVAGGWYPLGIFVGILPLVAYMKGSAKRLRANFTEVIAAQQKAATLAARLDTALNNMSHGLCMVDARGRLILTNEQALKIFGVRPGRNLAGAKVNPILRGLVQSGVIAAPQFRRLEQALFHDEDGTDVVVPLETRDGRAFEVTIHRMEGEGSVVVIQDVTERRNAQNEINRMARFDAVTNLPNRRCFEEELALALRPNRPTTAELTVMFLDLDNFKQVNDSLGHTTGDKLLAEIGRRLGDIVGPLDMVARWGGDEFVILHRHGGDQPDTKALARRMIDEIGRAVVVDGIEVIVGASIGTASAPDDGSAPDILLSNADIALYAAKADGRRSWRAFEREMDTKIQVRRLIELELRAAVATDAIDVHFQPIVDVKTRQIVSFEALARWRHPTRGAVSPTDFIPIVEEIGLMEEFGACVLRRACEACAAWPEDVSVSVNLSPSQFRSGAIEAIIEGALRGKNLRPGRLDLEITESTLLDERSDSRRTLEALRARGCRISLDDFGTGYSSLSYLLSFPLDRVKIDQSFTVGLGVQERASILVESVATMSRKLGMTVLIEGVETERQMRIIEQLGTIAEVQGFLFSPPVAATEALALVGSGGRLDRAAAAA
jgi:diguanylate cyclase (GGDEF)-like protein/PAS domain S-box-containing protein